MSDIKLGIVGTNFVSDWLADATLSVDGITTAAVCSRTMERAEEFAAKHGCTGVFCDYDKYLASDIDAVYIAVPNCHHFRYAKAALEAGKHVLLEKPATLDSAHFDILTALAKKKGVVILEAMRPGHDPAIREAKAAMGEIGKVHHAVFDFCQYSSRYDKFRAGEILNAFKPELGNAAVMDIGCYALHTCMYFFGEPKAIHARSIKLHNGFEGQGNVLFEYDNLVAGVVYSKITESFSPSVITGEDGWIVLEKLSFVEKVSLFRRPDKVNPARVICDHRPEDNMIYELADFRDCVKGILSPDPFNEVSAMTMRAIDEIRRQNDIPFPSED